MSSKIVKFHKTKEKFNSYIIKNVDDYSMLFPIWHCGYIVIPAVNVKYINDIYIFSVHGGITFTTYAEFDKKLILGFDCAHLTDSPQYSKRPKSVGYCKDQIDKLSKQIKATIIRGRKKMIKNKIMLLKGL